MLASDTSGLLLSHNTSTLNLQFCEASRQESCPVSIGSSSCLLSTVLHVPFAVPRTVLWLVGDFLTCRMVGPIKDTLPFLYWNRGGIWDTLLPPSLSTSVSEQTAFPPAHPLENDEIRLSKEGESIFHKTFYWEIIAKVTQCSADVITIGSVVLETVLVLCVSSPRCHCA